ncbi:MAG: ribosome biogenesis GTPase Der [Opitutales bacterium]
MDPRNRTVALVGRPNVGKSRLFNSLLGRRVSIVHDQPGVTRDVVTGEVGDDFTLMDTGGLGLSENLGPRAITEATESQVDLALAAAGVVAFVVDGREGPTPLDDLIADKLRRIAKPVILVVNKIDDPKQEASGGWEADFAALGFERLIAVSAEHDRGLDALRQAVIGIIGPPKTFGAKPAEAVRTRLAVFGRPNVGKSSLANALLGSQTLMVSEIPGTTRDTTEHDLDWAGPSGPTLHFRLCDTAGLRALKKIRNPVEYFSTVRSRDTLKRADVAVLVLDALDGVTKMDQALAGEILEAGKGVVVVVNKWDLALETFRTQPLQGYQDEAAFRKDYKKAVLAELFFLPDAPVVFTSAREGLAIDQLLRQVATLNRRMDQTFPTAKLNQLIHGLFEDQPPRQTRGKRFKIYYAVQTGNRPYRIRCFCNNPTLLDDGYKRYILNGIYRTFDLAGCPLFLEYAGKEQRFTGPGAPEAKAPMSSRRTKPEYSPKAKARARNKSRQSSD